MVVPACAPWQGESSDCPWCVDSTGVGAAGLEELCRAQHCGNHTVQFVLSKNLPAVVCVAVNPCLIPAAIPIC